MDKESAKRVINNLAVRRKRLLRELRIVEDEIKAMAGDFVLDVDYEKCEAT